ncbi:MAG: Do family serine endopeptidase [Nitrospirota bacterium]|nr:Do family serine endopeptidase [Nitrospirota bacterium]
MNSPLSRYLASRFSGLIPAIAVLVAVGFLVGEYMPASHASNGGSPLTAATVQASPPAPASGNGFAQTAKAITPAVVNITATATRVSRGHDRDRRDPMEEPFGFPGRPHGPVPPGERHGDGHGGVGSGVIVSPDGYIVTNNHVVEGAGELAVTLPDKREFRGKVVGTDPKTDLAVIKVDGRDLPFVPWGDSSKLQVGEYVLAVGNPFGLNSTVTLGIVSGLGRGRMGITQYEDFIQTDAAINPGNSGGALVNQAGELVGINTAILSQTGGYQGVGFAVPVSMVKPVYESLVATGKVVRGYLGVGIQDLNQDLAKSFDLKDVKGALVSNVAEDSPAEQAGFKPGDVIVGYQGAPVEDAITLQRQVTRTSVGTKVPVHVMRNGKSLTLAVTIGEQPGTVRVASAEQATDHALAGLAVQGLDPKTARDLGLSGKTQGVLVVEVDPDSVVARAGIAPGDVIREINKQPGKSVQEFEKIAAGLKKDQQILLLVNRHGASLFISVKV